MEQVMGNKGRSLANWWYNHEGAVFFRFFLLFVLLASFPVHHLYSRADIALSGLNDFSAPSAEIYVPASITTKGVNMVNMPTANAGNMDEFIRADKSCGLHFVKVVTTDSGVPTGLEYLAMNSNESTIAYKYSHKLEGKVVSANVSMTPKSVKIENGVALVEWHHEYQYFGFKLAAIIVCCLVAAFAFSFLWQHQIRKGKLARVCPS